MDSSFIHKIQLVAIIAIIGILLATATVVVVQNNQNALNTNELDFFISDPIKSKVSDEYDVVVKITDERLVRVEVYNVMDQKTLVVSFDHVEGNTYFALPMDKGQNVLTITCYDRLGNVIAEREETIVISPY